MPGMPVICTCGWTVLFVEVGVAREMFRESQKSRGWTEVKVSGGGLDVRWVWAWGVVIIGRSRRREDSTFWSKWSLIWGWC